MRIPWIAAAALALAPAVASAQSTPSAQGNSQQGSAPTARSRGNNAADTSERGSRGSQSTTGERTGPPGAGIESGQGEALGGGRTDEGPAGGTGIRASANTTGERQQAKLDDQLRGANRDGSLLRPADSPADINRDPKAMGSGAPNVPPGQGTEADGKNYGADHPAEGRANGIASGEDNPSRPRAGDRSIGGRGYQPFG